MGQKVHAGSEKILCKALVSKQPDKNLVSDRRPRGGLNGFLQRHPFMDGSQIMTGPNQSVSMTSLTLLEKSASEKGF